GRDEEALIQVEELAQNKELDGVTAHFLGRHMYDCGRYESAKRVLESALNDTGLMTDAHLLRAKVLRCLGLGEEIQSALDSALESAKISIEQISRIRVESGKISADPDIPEKVRTTESRIAISAYVDIIEV